MRIRGSLFKCHLAKHQKRWALPDEFSPTTRWWGYPMGNLPYGLNDRKDDGFTRCLRGSVDVAIKFEYVCICMVFYVE